MYCDVVVLECLVECSCGAVYGHFGVGVQLCVGYLGVDLLWCCCEVFGRVSLCFFDLGVGFCCVDVGVVG